MTIRRHLKAAACLTAITLNLVAVSVALLLLLPVKAVPRWRPWFRRRCADVYRTAVRVDNTLLRRISRASWRSPELTLDADRPHILVANHLSWADVFIIQGVIATHGPLVKFLAKRELLYLPILGLIILAFDFPALRRRDRRRADPDSRRADDHRRVSEATAVLIDSPAAILSFAEGTRFTEAKRESRGGRYDRLLPPRAGGLAAMIEALAPSGGSIVDLTLVYPRPVTFWQFLGGLAGTVDVRWEKIPIADVAPERVQDWLNDCWQRKDELLRDTIFMGNDSDLPNLSEMQ